MKNNMPVSFFRLLVTFVSFAECQKVRAVLHNITYLSFTTSGF